jgi:hypothetical protein
MSLYAMNEGTELAALHFILATREVRANAALDRGEEPEDIGAVLSAIRQHPAAELASAVDDAWIAALSVPMEPCPYCLAAADEACRWDCPSRFEGES